MAFTGTGKLKMRPVQLSGAAPGAFVCSGPAPSSVGGCDLFGMQVLIESDIHVYTSADPVDSAAVYVLPVLIRIVIAG